MANERHNDAREWEVDLSTRQAVHPYTKYSPFRSATSTTAANLLAIDRGEIAVNWVTNPRLEVNATGYTAVGSSVARSTAQQATGAASLLTDPANFIGLLLLLALRYDLNIYLLNVKYVVHPLLEVLK